MSEMTLEQIQKLTLGKAALIIRRAAQLQREHRAITWEFGTDLVNIAAIHGDAIAAAILKSAAE